MITYHIAQPEDLEILIESRIEFMTDIWGKQESEVEENLRKQLKLFFIKNLSEKKYISCIARNNGEFAGVGGMALRDQPGSFRYPFGKMGYIMNMYTLPSLRRQGIGSRILDMLIQEGEKIGLKVFELHATKEGEPVYIKRGFKLNEQPNYRLFNL